MQKKDGSERRLKQCVVVTYSSSPPKSWCDAAQTPFVSPSDPGTYITSGDPKRVCTAIDLLSDPPGSVAIAPKSWNLRKGLPNFYAEIKLSASADQRGLLPSLIALYYPADLNKDFKQKSKARSLQISVSANTPDGAKALTSIVVRLDNLTPLTGVVRIQATPGIDDGTPPPAWALPAEPSRPWVSALALPEKYSPPSTTTELFPVNISTEVREIHDQNAFLQALAKVFAAQKDTLKKETASYIGATLNPASDSDVQSSYDALAATVYSAEAIVRNACKPPSSGTVNTATVQASLLSLIAAYGKLDSASPPKAPAVFSPDSNAVAALRG